MTATFSYPFSKGVRLHGKTPRVARTTRSYPMLLRDGILDRVKAMPYFANFTFSSNKMLQIQAQSLPFCGVYLIQETMSPDGDADAGEPRFRTMVRIGFSVIIVNNDPDAAEYQLDRAMQALTGGLFSDPTLYHNDQFQIQGYVAGIRNHVFGAAGADNETPIAELRFELTCDLGTIDYPPIVLDDLEVIHVKTSFPTDGTAAEKAAVQQVVNEYDLDQN